MVVEKSTPEGIHFLVPVALEFVDAVINAVSLIAVVLNKDSICWRDVSLITLGVIWVKRRRPLSVGVSCEEPLLSVAW